MRIRLLVVVPALLFASALYAQSVPKGVYAHLVNAEGKSIGTATLVPMDGGVHITANLSNLPPGTHALHIHAAGKCEAPGFTTAGPHFNPENKQHGTENPMGAHAGDLPSFDVAKDGTARLSVMASHVTLGAGEDSLFHPGGTALVIHDKADDNKTDPAGNAGTRIACGVIVASQ
jgi:Cu-Zn family superoxide dismutase